MTQERDIMTIKFRKIFSPNLFTENDSLILNHDSYTSAPDLVGNIAALSYISESVKGFPIGNLDEVNTKVAKSDLAKCLKAGHELYLFASDSVWQPDTKITKYYGLWRRLKKAYNELSMINNSDFSQEYIAKGNEGVKFAGVVRLGADNLDLGVSLVRENTGFQIYLSMHGPTYEFERVSNYFEAAYLKEPQFNVDNFIIKVISNTSAIVRVAGSGEQTGCSIDIIANSSSEIFTIIDLRADQSVRKLET